MIVERLSLLRSRSCRVPWRWRAVWKRSLGHQTQINFIFTHIYHEDNRVADYLASMTPGLISHTWWWIAPAFCSSFVSDDLCSMPSLCFVDFRLD